MKAESRRSKAELVTEAGQTGSSTLDFDRSGLSTMKGANRSLFKKSPWKMDFNQATSRQLIKAFERIRNRSSRTEMEIVDVILIGHSKSFIPYNEKTLEPFLKYIQSVQLPK